MDLNIQLKGKKISPQEGDIIFRGYFVQDGKLLRDTQAASVMTEFLKENVPCKLFETINGSFLFIYKKISK